MKTTEELNDAMSEDLKTHLSYAVHDRRIEAHYKHAREKHPYFCDAVTGYTPTVAKVRLNQLRTLIEWRAKNGAVTAEALVRCELLEAEEAVLRGDIAHAVLEYWRFTQDLEN